MFLLAVAAAASLMIGAAQPVRQMPPPCPSPQIADVWEHREDFGPTVFLFGDSIMRGWALGTFTPPTDHSLWCLRSPGSVRTTLQSANATATARARLLVHHGIPRRDHQVFVHDHEPTMRDDAIAARRQAERQLPYRGCSWPSRLSPGPVARLKPRDHGVGHPAVLSDLTLTQAGLGTGPGQHLAKPRGTFGIPGLAHRPTVARRRPRDRGIGRPRDRSVRPVGAGPRSRRHRL
jgi:hypothetical protein